MRASPIPSILVALGAAAVAAAAPLTAGSDRSTSSSASSTSSAPTASSLYIVQGRTIETAQHSVRAVSADVQQDLGIIRAVSAYLTASQLARLRTMDGVRIYEDRALGTSGWFRTIKSTTDSVNQALATDPLVQTSTTLVSPTYSTLTTSPLTSTLTSPLLKSLNGWSTLQDTTALSLTYQTNYPKLIGADSLQKAGITGQGVTIAVLDTGLWQDINQFYGPRVLATVDVVNGAWSSVGGDPYGHGTHVTGIAASGAQNLAGEYLGIAPKSNLVVVRAFDGKGAGRYTDVIAGVDWIVANKRKYNIRVLNLSFGAPPQSYYWDDPLNQAVMAAWRAGIVVVVSAGNDGPSPMTINVPGNVPYVITVGALTDGHTPYDATDDRLASFSSAGPTHEGFVKPEMIAPGGHIVASMPSGSYLANIDPGSVNLTQQLFTMSGTSQAAAVTSGVVALMLQADPTLTPDMVKCRLLSSSRPAVKSTGKLAYSVFQQGAGLINALSAVNGNATDCANRGLDIDADLAGTAHFGGPANVDAYGNYYVMDMAGWTWGDPLAADGYTWSRGYTWTEGYAWSDGYTWSRGYTWSKGYTWSRTYTWSSGYTWSKGYTWSRSIPWWSSPPAAIPSTSPASIASWVPNE